MIHPKSVLVVLALTGAVSLGQPRNPPAEPKFNSEAGKVFAAKVQPILTNRCANCHARPDHASGYRLRPIEPGINDPQGAEENLKATARWISPANPHASPLLKYANTAHGSAAAEPPLPGEHVAYKNLELWVHWACGPEGSALPAAVPPPSAAIPERWTPPVQRTLATNPVTEGPAAVVQTGGFASGVVQPEVVKSKPTDPFDPAEFNRGVTPIRK